MEELAVSGAVLGIIIIVGLLYLFLIAYTIYHAVVKNKTASSLLWVILILFFPLIGCIIYWVVYSSQRESTTGYRR